MSGDDRPVQALADAGAGGSSARVGRYACVLPGAALGANVDIGEHVFVDDAVEIAGNATIHAGAKLYAGLAVAEDVVIGANAVVAAALQARSDQRAVPAITRIGRGAQIGANAVVLCGMSIGERARVEPGAVVNVDVPHDAIVAGNPARIVGYVDTPITRSAVSVAPVQHPAQVLRVRGASLVAMPQVHDLRGVTTFAEVGKQLPFVAKRVFFVADVPGREVRGEHAHKTLHEFLVCMKGALSVMLDDGIAREEVRLDSPMLGLHVPPQVWRVVYKYTPDALLLSLCSHEYDPADYIRDYGDFVAYVSADR